ncbi:hypothetical protein W03_15970 [Nitrosomonas sp. PY1]|nr:hypothetical protein W03_15970 [Nitrosomonas sp. PY1]
MRFSRPNGIHHYYQQNDEPAHQANKMRSEIFHTFALYLKSLLSVSLDNNESLLITQRNSIEIIGLKTE